MTNFDDVQTDTGTLVQLDATVATKARLTVANYAEDPDDLNLLLAILGLDDGAEQPVCTECGDPITRVASDGHHRTTGSGLCSTHYRKKQKQAERARKAAQTEQASPPVVSKACKRCGRERDTGMRRCPFCNGMVDAEPAREQIAKLRAAGKTLAWIAAEADISVAAVRHMFYRDGEQATVYTARDKADRVLAIVVPTGAVWL